MSTNERSIPRLVALSLLFLPASARVLWIPEEFDPSPNTHVLRRNSNQCGGDSSLTYCGGGMPSGFCCSTGYTCLQIVTNTTVQAAMCCPQGSKCNVINPVSCDVSLQNITITQLHADPPQPLKQCGAACCPMGYGCNNGQCVAAETPVAPSNAKPPPSATTAAPTKSASASGSTFTTASTSSSPSGAAGSGTVAQHKPTLITPTSRFNGGSFAAGFVPGIALGALIAACIILCLLRRKKRETSQSYVNEKGKARDTLTDLGPLERRPTTHGRNISEPKADPSAGHRTDFLRSTPPRDANTEGAITNGYVIPVPSRTPSDSPPRVRALFSRSPFMSQYPSTPLEQQAPLPAHLKRGTLSFKISPVRALRKQKSQHSLRRQITDASLGQISTRSDSSRRKTRQGLSRSGSTETIQVLMPSNEPYTPERRPAQNMPEHIQTLASVTYQAPSTSTTTSSTWTSTSASTNTSTHNESRHKPTVTYASSSRYPSEIPQLHDDTPTRPPVPRIPPGFEPTLGSPYTPTNARGKAGQLGVQREDTRRDTTFSAMMERAGLRRSDLLIGGGGGKDRL